MSVKFIKIIYRKKISIISAPKNMAKEDEKLFAHMFSRETREASISTLNNVYVLSDSVFSLEKFHFYDLGYPISKLSLYKNLQYFLTKGDVIEKAIFIIPKWKDAYFHWLTDALPRLILSEYGENKSAKNIVLLPREVDNRRCAFIAESLNLLDYKIHWYKRKIFVKELTMPSYTAESGSYNKEIINILRDRFLKKTQGHLPYRNIFISRKKANRRKIVNEVEVRELMKLYGYETHYFEDYTLEKQIEIMSQTKSLVGLHGAGLTNMLFMPAGATILEFKRRNDCYNNCYFSLSSDLNHEYYYQQCEGISSNTMTTDVIVDLKELKKNLELMTSIINKEKIIELNYKGFPRYYFLFFFYKRSLIFCKNIAARFFGIMGIILKTVVPFIYKNLKPYFPDKK